MKRYTKNLSRIAQIRLHQVLIPLHSCFIQFFYVVRQGGATSLSYLAKANVDLLDRIEEFVQKCFDELKDQTADGSKHGRLEPGIPSHCGEKTFRYISHRTWTIRCCKKNNIR